jgi:hypothetical protein
MKIIGQHILNESAIAWADLDRSYQEDRVTYRYEREFAVRDRVERVTKIGIYVRFIDGSELLWPTTHPDYEAVRAWLTGDEAPTTLPIETEIMAGLPTELQAMFGGR